jgi:hypothetical protein
MRVAAAAGTARPTSAPILAGGAAQVSETLVPVVPQEASRTIALGSGLALVMAAAVVGIVALVVRRRIR